MKTTFPLRLALLALSLLMACPLFAQPGLGKLQRKPVPAWVKPVHCDMGAPVPAEQIYQGFYQLLNDSQWNVPQQAFYYHRSEKILDENGLEPFSELQVDFDPAYERVELHTLRIWRDGQWLDRLKMDAISVAQTERRADRHQYDGTLSAFIFVEDLRVGDILDFAYTTIGSNPILQGHVSSTILLNQPFPIGRMVHRVLLPASYKGRYLVTNAELEPKATEAGGYKVLEMDRLAVPPIQFEDNVPDYHDPAARIQFSDFANWEEVEARVGQLFGSVNAGGPNVQALADSFARAYPDSAGRALAALRMVQDEIRYLGLESGIHGFQPHASELTLRRRYGDCKDKSLLLVGLLRAMGIAAWPVLVHSVDRETVAKALPTPFRFDHCIVKMRLGGHDLWMDPTMRQQGGILSSNAYPNYRWGLVVGSPDSAFQAIPLCPVKPRILVEENWRLGEPGGPVDLVVKTTFRGIDADLRRQFFAANSLHDLEQTYLQYVAGNYGKADMAAPISIEDDRMENKLTLVETYHLLNPWSMEGSRGKELSFSLVPSLVIEYVKEIQRMDRKQPWALEFPLNLKNRILVEFPRRVRVLPESESVTGPEFDYALRAKQGDAPHQLVLDVAFTTKKNAVAPEQFEAFALRMKQASNNNTYRIRAGMYSEDTGPSRSKSNFNWSFFAVVGVFGLVTAGTLLWLWYKGRLKI